MRVLCVYYNYPQLSATYVEAEIRFLLRHGIEVEVWAETDPGSPYEAPCRVHRGRLCDAERSFRPDIIHFYWFKMLSKHLDSVSCPRITVRTHSFEIQPEELTRFQPHPRIKGLFLFPHQAAQLPSLEKVIPLPVVYDSRRFPPGLPAAKRPDLIACCTAGLPKKALEVFFETATLCRGLRFVLALATCSGHGETINQCIELNNRLGQPVDIRVDLPHAEVVPLLREAGCYLCTQRASKRGMPIAIAEALASGCHVLVPRFSWLTEMIGPYGATYQDAADAATRLGEAQAWSPGEWVQFANGAASYASAQFSDEAILPQLLRTWEAILREKP
jgi:glycosyltransferase involved in cell wall biosynthesis